MASVFHTTCKFRPKKWYPSLFEHVRTLLGAGVLKSQIHIICRVFISSLHSRRGGVWLCTDTSCSIHQMFCLDFASWLLTFNHWYKNLPPAQQSAWSHSILNCVLPHTIGELTYFANLMIKLTGTSLSSMRFIPHTSSHLTSQIMLALPISCSKSSEKMQCKVQDLASTAFKDSSCLHVVTVKTAQKYRLNFLNIVSGAIYYQCVYMLCMPEAPAMAAAAEARKMFDMTALGTYMPHLSLVRSTLVELLLNVYRAVHARPITSWQWLALAAFWRQLCLGQGSGAENDWGMDRASHQCKECNHMDVAGRNFPIVICTEQVG